MNELIEQAENLRDYLVDKDFAGDDGDIPNEVWLPFCAALKSAERAAASGVVPGGTICTPAPRSQTAVPELPAQARATSSTSQADTVEPCIHECICPTNLHWQCYGTVCKQYTPAQRHQP